MHTVDPAAIFHAAEKFRRASQVLRQTDKSNLLASPDCVLAAFACELYLKCLLRLEGNKPQGHNLRKLFDKLSSENQDWIRRESETHIKQVEKTIKQFHPHGGQQAPTIDFDWVLNQSAGAFVKFRYSFEEDLSDGLSWLADGIALAVRKRIRSLRPEWAATYYETKRGQG